MATFNSSLWLVHLFLQLNLFLQTPDATRFFAKVKQEPEFLSASVGENITLHCILTRAIVRRTVKWYKGSQALEISTNSRVRRLHPGSQTDFSILIPNIEPQDAGTYYCVNKWHRGKGSVVFVIAPPRVWLKTDPPLPVQVNDTVTLTCYVEGFYPRDITFNWLDDKEKSPLKAPVSTILNQDGTFSLRSSLKVTATKERSSSVFTCSVVQNFQSPVSKSAVVKVVSSTSEPGEGHLFPSYAFWIGFLLNKVTVAFILLCLFLRKQRSEMNP